MAVVNYDFEGMLGELTGSKGWEEAEGPDISTGDAYYYVSTDTPDGKELWATIYVDQGHVSMSAKFVDDEVDDDPAYSDDFDPEDTGSPYAAFVMSDAVVPAP